MIAERVLAGEALDEHALIDFIRWRRWFGSRSERAAGRFLQNLGYRILARNFTCRLGEIDLIAQIFRVYVHCVKYPVARDLVGGELGQVEVEIEQVQCEAFGGAQLQAKEPAQQVLIGEDPVAENFALKPSAPIALAIKQRVERLVGSLAAPVTAEAGKTIA